MRTLSNSEYKTFRKMCGLSQEGLKKTMFAFLSSKYNNVIETQDYIYAVGDIPIALVAHLDTVFPRPAKDIYYDREQNVIWSTSGLGADDRAGVYAITRIIRDGHRPHVIFTTDEECGAFGATAIAQGPVPFDDLRYIIELDRRGVNDCVFYECDNPEFTKYIESFGFSEAIGSFSDISMICEYWKIAGVNLSIGYKNEHSTSEVLFVGHMLNTIDKVITMLTQNIDSIPKFEFIPAAATSYYRNWYKYYNNDWDRTHCYNCGLEQKNEDMIPVKMVDGTIKFFCIDCLMDNVKWCKVCGEAYEPIEENTLELCNDCRFEFFNKYY